MDSNQPIIPVEEHFRIIADSAPVLIWIANTDKLCYFFNAGWLRFTGRTMEQEYGNGWAEGVHPDDLQRCLDIYITSFDARKEFKIEYRLRRYDGRYQWLLDNGVPRYTHDGTFAGYIGSCVVIDELLEMERAKKEFIHAESLETEQALNEELATANEELAATNEELVSINEELYQAQESLSKLNNELEEKVRMRTGALAKSEAQAHALNEELAARNKDLMETHESLQRINNELAESESRLKMAIESTNLGTWDWNPVNDNLYLSRESNGIFGFPDGELITSETFFGCIFPDDKIRMQQRIEKAKYTNTGPHYDLTCRINRFNNKDLRWIRVQGSIHYNAEGRAMRFIGTILDITEDKLAEEKSAKLAAIIASSDDAIISKTLESVITSWNESAERMFGYSADEIIGETIYKLIPADRQEEEPEILSRLKNGERVTHFETKRVTKDGRLIDVSLTVSPVKDPEGNIIGLSKIARDITEKKLDETRKNDFIGMVSHELKTPLTSLTGLLQLASIKLKDSGDSFLPGAMEKANLQVKRMSSMINGFLNVSRLEAGKITIDRHEFNLEELIEEVIKETEFTVSTHTLRFEPCEPVTINADYYKISSVITNLISNAIKYSPKGKVIEIQCRPIGDTVQVSVKDEGMGIKPQDREKLFERYYRVENNHTQHISGFGIGLYLSSEIIHRHGGRIWIESEPGIGSTFFFSLPLSATSDHEG
jgi:PAS domain S-box-containing protein